MAIGGTIDLDSLLARGTPAQVEAEVRRHIEGLGGRGGFFVGSSSTPAFYVNIDNLRAMLRATVQHGQAR